jgi:GntR family transcriptional regulator/MocR family aminotransferase
VPDLSLFPRRAWLAALHRAFASLPDAALDYPDPRGSAAARQALAAYLNRARATVAREERVVFCNGSAQGIGLLCRVLRDRGVRRIAVEDPGHADQCTNIQASELETPRVPVDDRGIRVDRLGRIDAGAVLVTPAHQYPTGSVLAPERRAALLEWAARQRAVIIEDGYDAEYRYDRAFTAERHRVRAAVARHGAFRLSGFRPRVGRQLITRQYADAPELRAVSDAIINAPRAAAI